MAEYNGNNIDLRVNGVDVKARWREFTLSKKVADVDVSAGANQRHEKHAAGLEVISAKMTLMYDDVAAATDMTNLYVSSQVVAITFGPEGNTAGKPKHVQSFKINSVNGPSPNHKKDAVMLEYDLVAAGAPTSDIYTGATF